jgi:ketosteroid isomerase-like protein
MTDALRAMADREAIRDLACRYADCVWRQEVGEAIDLFTDDGVMDMGDRPPITGRAALTEAYRAAITGPPFYPFVHNHVIDLGGDRATGRCYLDLRCTIDGRSMTGVGYYEDVYVRRAGQWKFLSRKLRMKHLVPAGQGWD